MDNIHYEIILFWSKEDQAFIAEVPELADCAADGATRQEALANVEVVIAEWIETARELGRQIHRCLFAFLQNLWVWPLASLALQNYGDTGTSED